MAEITSEMIDNIIEAEKEHNKAVEKQFDRIISKGFAPLLGIEIIISAALLGFSVLKALAAAAISVVLDILLFLIVTEILTAREMKFQAFALVSIYRKRKLKRFAALVDAAPTTEEKLRLYCENIKKSGNKDEKLSAISQYINFVNAMCAEQDIDWVYEELIKIRSEKFITKSAKLQDLLLYFIAKGDCDGFIRTFEENQGLIKEMWDYALFSKLDIVVLCCEYFRMKKEYQKQLEYYDILIEFHEKASEIDVKYALTDEMRSEIKIDYAKIYCRLGRYEEAAECLHEAEEKLKNNDKPYIKKGIEEAGKMLEEADTNNTEGK